jgi:hypothetical protein
VNIRFWGSVNSLYSQISQLASSQPTFADVLLVSTSDSASVRYHRTVCTAGALA